MAQTLSGIGSILNGIGNIAGLFGNSTTDTNGNQSTTSSGSTYTQNSALTKYLQSLFGAAGTAENNATNSSATNALVQNIFRQSQIAFAPTQAKVNSAGLYGGGTEAALGEQAEADATGQAASAVLNYQTQQADLGGQLLSTLVGATKTTNTAVSGESDQSTTGTSATQKGVSVVCTEMMKQGRLPRTWWKVSGEELIKNYGKLGVKSYQLWGRPLAKYIHQYPFSVTSAVICWIFYTRTEYLCWKLGVKDTNFRLSGMVFQDLMFLICCVCYPIVWVRKKLEVKTQLELPNV